MHINNNEFEKFQNGTLDSQDMIAFLEHLAQCNYCLEELLEQESKSCISAPSYLKDQIIEKAHSPEVRISRAACHTSYKMQMFYYSLRTALGVLAALFMLFCIGNTDISSVHPKVSAQMENTVQHEIPQKTNHLYNFTQAMGQGISTGTDSVTAHLNDLSNIFSNGGK